MKHFVDNKPTSHNQTHIEASEKTTIGLGVPKGRVLGSLLFLCHINYIPLSIKSNVCLFDDDCLL